MIKLEYAAAGIVLFFSASCGGDNDSDNPVDGCDYFLSDSELDSANFAWLHGDWVSDSEPFRISISAQNETVVEVSFQVGSEGDAAVPFPTVCHYKMTGIAKVTVATDEVKKIYQSNGQDIPEYTISHAPSHFELVDDNTNDAACAAFIAEQNKYTSNCGSSYGIDIKKISDTQFVDIWYNQTYLKK